MSNSVVITIATMVFNGVATIAETIESVVKQSYPNIEYLIIDGASTDNTLAIARHYASLHTCIKITSEPDKGIYDAMNKAQQQASGDFLLFLGCDDVLYNHTVIEEFVTLAGDKNNIYYGDVMAKDCREIWYGSFAVEKIILQNISHQAIFYPKKIYKQHVYNLKYKLFADWDYNLRAWSQYGVFTRMELIVAIYAQNGASSNNNYDRVFLADRAKLIKKYFGNKYAWLVKMQKVKQRLLGKTDFRKVKGYIFPKLK